MIVHSDVDDYLHISSSDRVDLDVFLNRPVNFQYPDYELLNGKCCHLEVLSYARDLFAAFCAVLVRMYLNYTIDHFSDLTSQVSFSEEGKIIRRIFWFALDLLHKFFDINYSLIYQFFDMFDEINSNQCFVDCANKQKLGPYNGPKRSLETTMF